MGGGDAGCGEGVGRDGPGLDSLISNCIEKSTNLPNNYFHFGQF